MSGLRNVSKGMMAALILSVLIAFMISLIPTIQLSKINQGFPVFNHQQTVRLSNQNMVDFVSTFNIELSVKKVLLKHNTLFVDFLIKEEDQLEPSVIYKDLFAVIQKGFVFSENTDEVILRVFFEDMEKVFMAVSAQKSDVKDNPFMELKGNMGYKEFLEIYFGINYGDAIKRE